MTAAVALDRWISTRAVATRLNVHICTVKRLSAAGAFGPVLLLSPKDKRISEQALEKFIASRLV